MKQRIEKIPGLKVSICPYNKQKQTREFEAFLLYYNQLYRLLFTNTCVRWEKECDPHYSMKVATQENLHCLTSIPGVVQLHAHRLPTKEEYEILFQYNIKSSSKEYRIFCSGLQQNIRFHKILEGESGGVSFATERRLSMDTNNQTQKRIFHHSEFATSRFDEIARKMDQKGINMTVVIATKNNESTIGRTLILLRDEQYRHAFVHQLLVADNDSTDNTREIASAFGATVYRFGDILPEIQKKPGENGDQWNALCEAQGDILVFIDGGISNIQPDMLYALAAPLILNENIKYVKAFYEQDISQGYVPTDKQCLTKFVIHPLLSVFYPELLSIIQPLSGMYAVWENDLEKMPFPSGYGSELGQLIETYRHEGLSAIGQVELECVRYGEQLPQDPREMSKDIINAIFSRISSDEYQQKISAIQAEERSALLTLDIPGFSSMKEKTGTYS